eukprot:GFUD01040458.1.p1 GENE.GFUD01040458.1~~GFUD01040458.1.p1  ORF type:complete len:244 (+),score=77.32 GFUD01040458.1:174-905(+)
MSTKILTFASFNLSHQSTYIVQGCSSFKLYHIISAEEKDDKRKFLLFIPRGSLNPTIRNWEDWRNCKKASYEVVEYEKSNTFKLTFDVDDRFTRADHEVIEARNEKEFQLTVDRNEMLIFDEEHLKVKESVFALKFKKEKTKGAGFKEIRSIIDINTAHILKQKTEKVKTKFLADTGEEFLTKVEVVNKVGKVQPKKMVKLDKSVTEEATSGVAALKRSVDGSKAVEPEAYISKRGRVSKKSV